VHINLLEYFPKVQAYYWSLSEKEEQSIKAELENAEMEISDMWIYYPNLDIWYSHVLVEFEYDILLKLVKSWKVTKETIKLKK